MRTKSDSTRFADYCNAVEQELYTPARITPNGYYRLIAGIWQPAEQLPKPELRRLQNQIENPCRRSAALQ